MTTRTLDSFLHRTDEPVKTVWQFEYSFGKCECAIRVQGDSYDEAKAHADIVMKHMKLDRGYQVK